MRKAVGVDLQAFAKQVQHHFKLSAAWAVSMSSWQYAMTNITIPMQIQHLIPHRRNART